MNEATSKIYTLWPLIPFHGEILIDILFAIISKINSEKNNKRDIGYIDHSRSVDWSNYCAVHCRFESDGTRSGVSLAIALPLNLLSLDVQLQWTKFSCGI